MWFWFGVRGWVVFGVGGLFGVGHACSSGVFAVNPSIRGVESWLACSMMASEPDGSGSGSGSFRSMLRLMVSAILMLVPH